MVSSIGPWLLPTLLCDPVQVPPHPTTSPHRSSRSCQTDFVYVCALSHPSHCPSQQWDLVSALRLSLTLASQYAFLPPLTPCVPSAIAPAPSHYEHALRRCGRRTIEGASPRWRNCCRFLLCPLVIHLRKSRELIQLMAPCTSWSCRTGSADGGQLRRSLYSTKKQKL